MFFVITVVIVPLSYIHPLLLYKRKEKVILVLLLEFTLHPTPFFFFFERNLLP